MIYNFKTEIKKVDCDLVIKRFLENVYAAEESTRSDPSKSISLAYYDKLVNKCYINYKKESL